MLEKRVENSQTFNLLSSDLADIGRASRSEWASSQRGFSTWIGEMDLSIFETDFFDERVAFDVAEYLMRRLSVFGHLPIPAMKLEAHYKEAKAGGDDYWRFALKTQQDRLSGIVKGVPPLNDLDKQLRNVRRGIERASETLAVESDTGNQLRVFAMRLSNRMRKPGGLPATESPHEVVSSFVEEMEARVDKIYDKILNLEDEADNLDYQIRLRRFVDEIVEATREALLNVERKVQSVRTAPISKPTQEIVERETIKKRRSLDSGSVKKAEPKAEIKEKFDNLEITKSKIAQVIEVANRSGNRLRILIPNEGKLRASFEPKWKGVLEKMGFYGSAEFVIYDELKRTNDSETPLIVFRGMNTHGNLWDRKKFNNVVVVDMAPVLIMNSL